MSIYDECFKSKFCYGNPLGCIEGKNCDILATVTLVNSSKHVIIDLYRENLKDNQWVAVAFSDDISMGDELVFMSSPSEEMLMAGWNRRHAGPPEDVTGITVFDYSKSNKDGTFHCQFELEEILTFTKVGFVEQITVDFSQLHHILLAAGPMQSKRTIGYHTLGKAASEESVIVTTFMKNERIGLALEGSTDNLFYCINFSPISMFHSYSKNFIQIFQCTLEINSTQSSTDGLDDVEIITIVPHRILEVQETTTTELPQTTTIGNINKY